MFWSRGARCALIATVMLVSTACPGAPEDPTQRPTVNNLPDMTSTQDMSTLGQACGGTTGQDCPQGSYCQTSTGQCDTQGVCRQAQGLDCPTVIAPVCGCDGVTYPNDCVASTSGVNVASLGECSSGPDCDALDACGPVPPVAPPEPCPDGTIPTVTTSCADQDGTCGWNVTYEACPEAECDEEHACPDGSWCQAPQGVCGGPGVCAQTPDGCPENYDPVCGCDGTTYGNACEAQVAGVGAEYEGECVDPKACDPDECGPSPRPAVRVCQNGDQVTPTIECRKGEGDKCGWEVTMEATCIEDQMCDSQQRACPRGYFCQADEATCGDTGTCSFIADVCPKNYAPVCGCDDKTYGNECEARRAGVSVQSQGECGAGQTCGGITGGRCGRGDFCKKPTGTCRVLDGQGTCTEMPGVCSRVYDPVCGCDNQTYGNACNADAAGVSVSYQGKCVTARTCGGAICMGSEYCKTPDGECGVSSQGSCTTPPRLCPQVFNPVCGCDNKTYSNSCVASAASVSVTSTGACR